MRYIDLSKKQPKKTSSRKRRAWPKFLVVGGVLGLGSLFLLRHTFSLAGLLRPISAFSQIVNPRKIQSTDGRTNVLLLALDRRKTFDPNCGGGGGSLTDTIILASLDLEEKDAVLISIPRDLWVETGYFSGKINSAFVVGERNGRGAEFASRIVEGVTGVPVHYYVVVDFSGFKKAIDILGGIEVEVERAFDDYKYPIAGKECTEPEEERWKQIHFDQGLQTMDGERALEFVRSRRAMGREGSDFARSRRQQKVLIAMRGKTLSFGGFSDFSRVKELYETYKEYVETNLSLSEIQGFLGVMPEVENFCSEVLGGETGLFTSSGDSEEFNGAWVLIPRAGDFSEVRAYVNDLLFGSGK